MLANKLIEKIPNPRNAKEHYQSFIKYKTKKLAKQQKIITYRPKTFENPKIVDIKSVILEQAEKASSNSFLYSDFLNQKM